MKILEVNHLKKIYVSHLSSNQVEALSDVTFSIEQGDYGRIRIRKNYIIKSACLA